jgi:hypothetical protein
MFIGFSCLEKRRVIHSYIYENLHEMVVFLTYYKKLGLVYVIETMMSQTYSKDDVNIWIYGTTMLKYIFHYFFSHVYQMLQWEEHN